MNSDTAKTPFFNRDLKLQADEWNLKLALKLMIWFESSRVGSSRVESIWFDLIELVASVQFPVIKICIVAGSEITPCSNGWTGKGEEIK